MITHLHEAPLCAYATQRGSMYHGEWLCIRVNAQRSS